MYKLGAEAHDNFTVYFVYNQENEGFRKYFFNTKNIMSVHITLINIIIKILTYEGKI
jgi:hypothetical protein